MTFMEWVLIIFLYAFSLLMMLNPALMWKIEHFMDVEGGRPTDWYLTVTRVGGVLLFLILFFITLFGLLIW